MVSNAADRLAAAIRAKNNPTAAGLDTVLSYLPEEMTAKCRTLADAADAVTEFNYRLIDAVYDIVPAVKVQVAYYEMYGWEGMKAFSDTLKYAKTKGLVTVSDCKRNDIGSTAAAYSAAHLGRTVVGGETLSAFDTDFLTVNAYLGVDGIAPFLEDCKKYGKGIFILCKTSNPGSGQLQDLKYESGSTLYETMGGLISEWGKELIGESGFSSVGAVVGATHARQAEVLRGALPHTFFLVPGYGAQGGKAGDLKVCFSGRGGAIVNNSRGIQCAYKTDKYKGMTYYAAAREAALAMREDLNSALE